MSAGTLTLTNNSAAVTGSGTTFTTELSAGDFIVVTVGGIPYTLPVKNLNNATSLTLVSNYTGPGQSGAAWYAVPRVAMNLVTAAMVAQNTEALRGLNYDKQNWQAIFSGTGDVTVKLPDGSGITGPAWTSILSSVMGLKGTLGATDLNTLTGANPGYYYQVASSAATPANNYPVAAPGVLSVVPSTAAAAGSCTQTYHSLTANRIFIRSFISPNWGGWQELFGANSVIPLANGGTGAATQAAARTALGVPAGTDAQMCTAWALANGAGALKAGNNISSVTLLQTGILAFTFATPMNNANYAVSASFDSDADAVSFFSSAAATRSMYIPESTKTITGFRVYMGYNASPSGLLNFRGINVSVFGGK